MIYPVWATLIVHLLLSFPPPAGRLGLPTIVLRVVIDYREFVGRDPGQLPAPV